jgi:hypothetical protein
LGVDEFMAEQNFVNERELWKSKRDLVINQVPITTKQALLNYGTLMKLLAVTNKRRTAL